MLTSWILSQNTGGMKVLFVFTLICAVGCAAGCLYFSTGRTKKAVLRLLVALVAADLMTELTYYLGYMAYLPGHEATTQAARLFPTILFPVLYFGGSALLVKIFNDMLSR